MSERESINMSRLVSLNVTFSGLYTETLRLLRMGLSSSVNLHTFDPQTMKNGESLMDRGQLREAQAAFTSVMDEMPFPVSFG